MKRERWEQLKTLFHGALDQPIETRTAWLIREAGSDHELAREAAALVASHETAGGFLETPASVDPGDVAAADVLEPGVQLGEYVIEREVGRGGMGIVYAARDLRLKRRVALKALPPMHDGDAAQRERLRREALAAANISDPHIATVYALEEINGRLFIASEFVEGHVLRDEIARGPLARMRALQVAADIASALGAAHAKGVVHRDLKPENVLITRSGQIKVVDFGIAHVESLHTRLTGTGLAVGTPGYMAPEQLLGGVADARVDIYALGIVLAEMLSGVHPVASGHHRVEAVTSEAATRCMQTDPRQRYQSAADALEAIRREMAQLPGTSSVRIRSEALWWWEFHQGMAAAVHSVMTWPAWLARGYIGGPAGNAVFVTVLAMAIVTSIPRLHLLFVSRFSPGELRWARGRASTWITVGDWLFTATLVVGGALVGDARALLALVLIAVGVGSAVAFALVEPATARAAFGEQ